MATRSILKSWFQTRKKPTEIQYAQLIDSSFNLDEDILPITKVDGLQNTLNQMQLSIQNSNSGGGSYSEVYVAVNGDFSKTFIQGKTLNSILIDPPGSGIIKVQIGTATGASDIVQDFTIDAAAPTLFERKMYFKVSQTWYFTGIPTNTTVTFFYQ